MLSIFASTKININLLTVENRDSTNLRNYEIPASHGFQLSERSDKIKMQFEEDEEIVLFSTNDWRKDERTFVTYYRELNSNLKNIDNGGTGPGMRSEETKNKLRKAIKNNTILNNSKWVYLKNYNELYL